MKTGIEIERLILDAITYAECEAQTRYACAKDGCEGADDEADEITAGLHKLEKELPTIKRAFTALLILRRGLESGIFDDAPVYKADVEELFRDHGPILCECGREVNECILVDGGNQHGDR